MDPWATHITRKITSTATRLRNTLTYIKHTFNTCAAVCSERLIALEFPNRRMRPAIPGICQATQIRRLSREFHFAWSARPWICLLTKSSIGQCSNNVSKASKLSQLTCGRCWLSSLCRCPIAGERSPSFGIFTPLDIGISLPGCLSSCGVMGQTMPTDLQPYTSCLEEGDPITQLHPCGTTTFGGRHLMLVLGWDRQTRFRVL